MRISFLVAAAALMSHPVQAETGQITREQLRMKIAGARADPAVARHGAAQIEAAERTVERSRAAENDGTMEAVAIAPQVDALVEAARLRARLAVVQEEIRQAEAQHGAVTSSRAGAFGQRFRDYRLRQTEQGATLSMPATSFETDGAMLRRDSAQRLQPLVGYLNANPDVRLRIQGVRELSREREPGDAPASRVAAVRAALIAAGVAASRIDTAGPATSRQVEITLLGQQAEQLATPRD